MQRFNKTEKDLQRDKTIFSKMKFDGVQPSPIDDRDFIAATVAIDVFPKEYESPETDILNQSNIGSCAAHSCVAALEHGEMILKQNYHDFSRGYIYGNRLATDFQGEGMVVRQALKQLNHCGDVLYADFPYNKKYPEVKALIEKNKDELAEKASKYKIKEYFRCTTTSNIKQCVMDNGAVIICVPVYSDFGRDLHNTKTNELEGYHAMAIVGWTSDDKWIVQNSWGKSWGYDGKLLMDFDYPVNEYWGIKVNADTDDNYIKRQCWFEKLYQYLMLLFQNLIHKDTK